MRPHIPAYQIFGNSAEKGSQISSTNQQNNNMPTQENSVQENIARSIFMPSTSLNDGKYNSLMQAQK